MPFSTKATRRRTAAFTFIEILVTMVMLSVLLFAAFGTLQIAISRWDVQTSLGYALQTVNSAEQEIAFDARNAVDFTTETSGSNTLYVFSLPADCQVNATYCTSGSSSTSNIDQLNANGEYVPEVVSGNLYYVDGPQVAYYLSDITGSTSVAGGTILWRALAPAGSSMFTPDKSWSLVNSSVARCPGVTSFALEDSTVNSNVPANAVEIDMNVNETSGHRSNSQSLTQDLYMMNSN